MPDPRNTRQFVGGKQLAIMFLVYTVAFLTGLAAVALFAWTSTTPARWSILALATIYALAAEFAGALLGFLFGVPRGTLESESGGKRLRAITPNGNMEQISDWLTKIIVGVSLTQLSAIRSGASSLFAALAPSLGGSATLAGGIVIYYSSIGFITGWLATRLWLGQAMSEADISRDDVVANLHQIGEHEIAEAVAQKLAS